MRGGTSQTPLQARRVIVVFASPSPSRWHPLPLLPCTASIIRICPTYNDLDAHHDCMEMTKSRTLEEEMGMGLSDGAVEAIAGIQGDGGGAVEVGASLPIHSLRSAAVWSFLVHVIRS